MQGRKIRLPNNYWGVNIAARRLGNLNYSYSRRKVFRVAKFSVSGVISLNSGSFHVNPNCQKYFVQGVVKPKPDVGLEFFIGFYCLFCVKSAACEFNVVGKKC
jgi:hypothetical protein